MTLQDLLNLYREKVGNIPMDASTLSAGRYRHILWMLDEIPQMTDEGKVNRWLGFIQGFLWMKKLYSINEMREQVKKILS